MCCTRTVATESMTFTLFYGSETAIVDSNPNRRLAVRMSSAALVLPSAVNDLGTGPSVAKASYSINKVYNTGKHDDLDSSVSYRH